jgi:hypothetical protein
MYLCSKEGYNTWQGKQKQPCIAIIFLGGSDDVEFGVLYFNSSQHSLNVSIPINNPPTKLSLRLLSDDFSCATIVPSTAHIILDADGKNNVK